MYENSSNQYIRSSLNVIRIFDRSGQFVCLLFHYNFTFSLIIDDYFVKSEYFGRESIGAFEASVINSHITWKIVEIGKSSFLDKTSGI